MAETKISKTQTESGIWTNTNLIAGNNINIIQVPKPEIDDNTVALFHFDEPLSSYTTKDQIHGFSMNSILIEINSTYHKFGASCLYSGRTGSGYFPACAFSTAEDGTTLSSQLDGNFTIDFWFLHLTNTKCMQGVYLGSNSSFSTTYKLIINGNSFSLTSPEETKSINIDKSGWSNGSWHHIAVIRNSNSKELSFYLDGIKQLGVNSETWVSMSYFTISGAPRYDNGEKGYFDELRISNSVRWTSNFTPFNSPYIPGGSEPIYQIDNIQDVSSYVTSTDLTDGLATKQDVIADLADIRSGAALGATSVQQADLADVWTQDNLTAGTNISFSEVPQPLIDSNTVALFHFDNNTNNEINNNYVVDSSQQPFAFDSTNYKFGGYSAYSSASSSSAITSSTTGITGDFTIDFWARYPGSVTTTSAVFYINGYNYYSILPYISATYARIQINNNTGGSAQVDTSKFNHFAIVHKDRYPYFFINGKLVYHSTYSRMDNPTTSLKLQIPYKSPSFLIDELRVSNVARWTTDFDVWTQPYTSGGDPIYQINNTQDLTSATGYDATKTQVLKNVNGTLTWVDEA